jgi:hypothetical protein
VGVGVPLATTEKDATPATAVTEFSGCVMTEGLTGLTVTLNFAARETTLPPALETETS